MHSFRYIRCNGGNEAIWNAETECTIAHQPWGVLFYYSDGIETWFTATDQNRPCLAWWIRKRLGNGACPIDRSSRKQEIFEIDLFDIHVSCVSHRMLNTQLLHDTKSIDVGNVYWKIPRVKSNIAQNPLPRTYKSPGGRLAVEQRNMYFALSIFVMDALVRSFASSACLAAGYFRIFYSQWIQVRRMVDSLGEAFIEQ